jgi:hypothetical protein
LQLAAGHAPPRPLVGEHACILGVGECGGRLLWSAVVVDEAQQLDCTAQRDPRGLDERGRVVFKRRALCVVGRIPISEVVEERRQ